jgi:hypothetical protein
VTGRLVILRIKVEDCGHNRRLRPWVAELVGACPRRTFRRSFVRPFYDWSEARRTMSGRVFGVVATFALRDGRLYEVSRHRGRASRRRVVREYCRTDGGQLVEVDREEVLRCLSENVRSM